MTWTYEASPTNEAVATAVGFLRQAPYLGQPERNRNYSEGDIWEAWQHQLTALAEVAWAGMLGNPNFIPSYNTHKGEPDVGQWEVRYGFQKNGETPGMRFSEGVDSPEAPYVLIVGGPEHKMRRSASTGYVTPPFNALGWMWGHECVRPEFETMYSTNPNRRKFLIPFEYLRSMDEIVVPEL